MLSYQPSYHAGGPADVHKHVALTLLLNHLTTKPKPASVIDLYAGNGVYALTAAAAQKTGEISLPVAITVFPQEVYRAPETWARRAYRNLSYFHEVDKGGHFAAWEEPELFSAELRAAFRPLRKSA